MYRVLISEKEGRILVTGKDKDLALVEEGWDLVFESFDWGEAFEYAMEIADEEIVEWYYDESVNLTGERLLSTPWRSPMRRS